MGLMFLQLHSSTGHTLQGDVRWHDAPHGDPPSARVRRRSDPRGGQERPGWSGVQHLTAGHAQRGLACPPQAGPQRSVPLVVSGLWLLSCLCLLKAEWFVCVLSDFHRQAPKGLSLWWSLGWGSCLVSSCLPVESPVFADTNSLWI